MTGYIFTLGGSVVSWKATLQPTVTSSTTEAEYMALTEAAKEGIWLKGLVFWDIKIPQIKVEFPVDANPGHELGPTIH
uniref:Reverse transcriptase Ty1/copia-type domain-containing protein n=1 Tax=Solanum lycopersicum TaxID=4081 RepID=A0A3Q7GN37_SOLLC